MNYTNLYELPIPVLKELSHQALNKLNIKSNMISIPQGSVIFPAFPHQTVITGSYGYNTSFYYCKIFQASDTFNTSELQNHKNHLVLHPFVMLYASFIGERIEN